jgi:hypothetical protein
MIIKNAFEYTLRDLDLRTGDIIVTESAFNGGIFSSIDFVISAIVVDDETIDIVCFHHGSNELLTFREPLDNHIEILSSVIRKS